MPPTTMKYILKKLQYILYKIDALLVGDGQYHIVCDILQKNFVILR